MTTFWMRTSLTCLACSLAGTAEAQTRYLSLYGSEGTTVSNEQTTPFLYGNANAGGLVNDRLISVYALGTDVESLSRGQISSRVDFAGIAPFVDQVQLRYSIQVNGLENLVGDGRLVRTFFLNAQGIFGDGFNGISGVRNITRVSGITTAVQEIQKLTLGSTFPVFSNRFDGMYTFFLTVNPAVTPVVFLQVGSSCYVESVDGLPSYCTNALGVRSLSMSAPALSRASLRMTTEGNAFAVLGGVPEPATWAMLIAGFGLVGVALRRQRRVLVPCA
jgi:hypothetical protein